MRTARGASSQYASVANRTRPARRGKVPNSLYAISKLHLASKAAKTPLQRKANAKNIVSEFLEEGMGMGMGGTGRDDWSRGERRHRAHDGIGHIPEL